MQQLSLTKNPMRRIITPLNKLHYYNWSILSCDAFVGAETKEISANQYLRILVMLDLGFNFLFCRPGRDVFQSEQRALSYQ